MEAEQEEESSSNDNLTPDVFVGQSPQWEKKLQKESSLNVLPGWGHVPSMIKTYHPMTFCSFLTSYFIYAQTFL